MNATRIIKVWLPDGLITVKAAPTPVPGLFVNAEPGDRGGWNVTHLASGCAMAVHLDSPEVALHVACKLGPVADWTLPGADLLGPEIAREARRILREENALPPAGAAWAAGRIAGMEPLT